MSDIGLICDVCDNEIDLSQFKGRKHKAFEYARSMGWTIGRGYLCPEHKDYYKNINRKESR